MKDPINGRAFVRISSCKRVRLFAKKRWEVGDGRAFLRDGYGCPLKGINLKVDPSRQELHAKDEEIEGHEVPLPNAPSGVKRGGLSPIN